MKKTSTAAFDAIEAALGGLDPRAPIPGTRPDLMDEVAELKEMLTPLLQTLPQAEPPEDLFDAIEAEIDGTPQNQTQAIYAGDVVWERRSEKIWKKVLGQDPDTGRTMYLLRCLPGAQIKHHPHQRAEHLFIIEGELWMGGKLFKAGDAQTSAPGSEHAVIDMPNGCLVLVSA
ncbi:cupin domain-containing protein [Sulfitobacter sp. JB4-11]|uniref:cupin domain-containing protein n=1 Tax=Sulfitobacter rhodophyticola TaxID=3238304 RepID=UPI003516345C